MLTPGNHKLGRSLIWGFGLPSGTPDTCPGLSNVCRADCYAVATERFRPAAAALYRRNLRASRRPDFGRRVRAFLVLHRVRVVHVGGDFYSPRYAETWLAVLRRTPHVRFYFDTRSWRTTAINAVIERMAALDNCRVWFSADRDTGVPPAVPPRVRVAWLMTEPTDTPPAGTHLVFRVRRLRRHPAPFPEPRVCPAEDGRPRPTPVTCERCGLCWRTPAGPRVALPVIEPAAPGRRP